MKIVTRDDFSQAVKLGKLRLPGLASLLMEIMKINEVNEVFEKAEHLQGLTFIDKILQILGISIEFDEQDLKNIPAEGAFIAIANHPYGGIEGLVLLKLLCSVRPDTRLMANFLLKKIPNLSDYFIAVNPFENIEHSSSISGIKSTLEFLRSGTPIGIFPAGEVSTFKFETHQVTDKLWHPVVGKIIAKANVPVIPVYFHGNNGLLFNLLSIIHPALQTARLPSELFNKQGHKIRVRIGRPILPSSVPYQGNPARLLDFLRARTYALGTSLRNEKKLFTPGHLFKIRKKPKPVIPAVPASLLEEEIQKLPEFRVWTEKNYEVYIAPTSHIPYIIREIGRLREITFREIGEGTNKEIDLDEYDIYYEHLFIWDNDNKMLVGAYRIGKGDEIFYSMGKRGFYVAELFKIREQFFPTLRSSLELGRSWIRKEYQQKPLPLFLLWKGILKYLIQNPRYRYLIGPVSISNSFSRFSKSLIVEFIYKHHFDPELAQYVRPRKKFKVDYSEMTDKDLLLENNNTLKDLDSLISEIETTHIKVPVLLRQYIALNAKIICFNIDPKFSDCLDGLLVADLEKIPAEMLEKIGKNISEQL